jgi:hypothetical protein
MLRTRSAEDVLATVALTIVALALSIATIVHRPQSTINTAFVFQDEGLNLLVASELASGAVLYRDLAYPYGPIPAYAHAAFAALFGNTPLAYLWFVSLLSSATIGLSYWVIRRAAAVPTAAFVAFVGMITAAIVPGSLIGGQTTAAYVSFERAMLLLAALLWRAPAWRPAKQSIAIGVALGVWQGVRFGGALVAGASVVVLDAASLVSSRVDRPAVATWLRSLAAIAAGFAVVEAAWIAIAFAMLPPAVARDTIWPSYMLETYAGWVTAEFRWLPWAGWRLFVAQYLVPCSAGLLGAIGLYRWSAGQGQRDDGALFLPLIFFAVGCASYFRQVHHFRQFMWTLVPASAWELQRRGVTWRTALAVLWAPAFVTLLRSSLSAGAAPALVSVALPAGGTIVATPPLAARLEFLQRFVASEAANAAVIYLDSGAGWYNAYRVPHATRHVWFAGFDAVRPYEEGGFVDALDRTAAVIECEKDDRPVNGSEPRLPFSPAINGALRPRLHLWTAGAGCRIYRLAPVAGSRSPT